MTLTGECWGTFTSLAKLENPNVFIQRSGCDKPSV